MKFLPMYLVLVMLELANGSIIMTAEEQKLMNLPKFPANKNWGILYLDDNSQGNVRQRPTKLPLDSIAVSVETYGIVAHVTSVFTYQNEKDEIIKDTEFVFPLDPNAAAYMLEVDCTGMKLIIAQVKEKQQAKKEYDQARDEGKTSALGTEEHADVFSFKLANLKPKTTCKATFKFVQEMYKYNFQEFNAFLFRYPVELSPRYGEKENVYMNMYNEEPKFEFELRVIEPENMKLEVDESFKIGDSGKSLKFQGSFVNNIDIFIHIEKEKPIAIVEKGVLNGSGFKQKNVMVINFNPKFESNSVEAQEFIMVVDRSGSMNFDDKINLAKNTILQWIENLPTTKECLFNIISFGSRFTNWKPESVPCTKENKSDAADHVHGMKADMDQTELYNCLQSILSRESPKGTKQVFVVTDGAITDQNKVINLVQNFQKTNRIFSFGIGHGASAALVQGIAQFNGVSRMIVDDVGFLENSVKHALTVAKAEFYKDIRVAFPFPTSPSFTTKIPTGLFKGVPFSVYTEIPSVVALENMIVTVEATAFDENKLTFEVEIKIEENPNLPIHVLAAKRLIKEWETGKCKSDLYEPQEDIYGQITETKKLTALAQQILALSKDMNVVSRVSSFIGTEEKASKDSLKQEKLECGVYQHPYIQYNPNPKRKRTEGSARESGRFKSYAVPNIQIPREFNANFDYSGGIQFCSEYNNLPFGGVPYSGANPYQTTPCLYDPYQTPPFGRIPCGNQSSKNDYSKSYAECQAELRRDEELQREKEEVCLRLQAIFRALLKFILKNAFLKMKKYQEIN